MPSFATSAINLFHRLFGRSAQSEHVPHPGVETVLDGNTAVAVTEACIAESAAFGATFPADSASFTWKAEQTRTTVNCLSGLLAGREAEGPRGALAAAIGQALAGIRATAFFSAPDLASAQDLLVMAAGRHLPLVAHVDNRALTAHAAALGSGHEVCHLSADSGCLVFIAANVQEAVDMTLAARRIAEQALLPVLVAMDGEQTAMAFQEVYLPSPELVNAYLGRPNDKLPVTLSAHKLVFGESRRRIPCWHNLDTPVLHGALQGTDSWALSLASTQLYFERNLDSIVEEAFALLTTHTGREIKPVSTYRCDDAHTVLVAQGAAIETAEAVIDHLRTTDHMKVGVLGIRCLRPLPGSQIENCVQGKSTVAVLERLRAPPASDPPLLRELRAVLGRSQIQPPHFQPVAYGLGGLPLRGADLIALGKALAVKSRPNNDAQIYLGIDFSRTASIYPKRQVLLDALRRDYPEMTTLGLKSENPSVDLRPPTALTVAIHRIAGQGREGLGMAAAVFLHQLLGGRVRSRPGLSWERFDAYCIDRFTHVPNPSDTPLRDPGDNMPVDLAVIAAPHDHQRLKPMEYLRDDGALLCTSPYNDAQLWHAFPATMRHELEHKNVALFNIAPSESGEMSAEVQQDRLLGAIIGTLAEIGRLDPPLQKVIARRANVLQNLHASEREARLNSFNAGLHEVRKLDYEPDLSTPNESARIPRETTPLVVRRLERIDDSYASLPRFWDHVGVLYRYGQADELTPDPYLATATVPPLSSSFRDFTDSRELWPAFDPQACTGCGQCWTVCPDSAIGAVALSARQLIDTGVRLAGAESVRTVASQLASQINALASQRDTAHVTAGDYIQNAYAWLKDQMSLDSERKQSIAQAVEALTQKLASLPLARTDAFFHEPERKQKDSGTLLSLAINPDTCKGCALCIEVCEHQALVASAPTRQHEPHRREIWNIWEQLPDTSNSTIEQVGENPEVDSMAALLLSRHCWQTLAGGDGAEAGSGAKVAVRLALATAEFYRRPQLNHFLTELDNTREQCLQLIHKILTDALPTDDLDALANGLESVRLRQIPLATLAEQLDSVTQGSGVDAAQLHRLVDSARQLGELHQRLAKGQYGLGRALLGLAVAPDSATTWAGVFPYNPFQVPVTLALSGDTPQLAAGLLEGQLRETITGFMLLRKVRLELNRPAAAARAESEHEHLSWPNLTPDEKRLVPPLLVIGNDTSLGGQGLAAVTWLLCSELPIKFMILSDLDLGLDAGGIIDTPTTAAHNPKINLGLLAVIQRQAYVAQTAISEPNHFRQSLKDAFEFTGPALIHVHAPSPERHGFHPDQTIEQARTAVAARVLPLFRYDPRGEGVFGSRIDLAGNPDLDLPWLADQPITPADWAFTERRFATHFAPLTDDDPGPLPIADYVTLDDRARRRKTPFVNVKNAAEEITRYRVDPALIAVTVERLHSWRTLQELTGRVTPFTAQVEARAQQKIAHAHQGELEALKRDYEVRIQDLEAEIALRIQHRLMNLAGYESVDN